MKTELKLKLDGLQRSRAHVSAERKDTPAAMSPTEQLQRSRAHVSAERIAQRVSISRKTGASTEPRSRERGEPFAGSSATSGASGFNGAALT